MLKSTVVKFFGEKQQNVANALNISKGAVSQWGDIIPEAQAMRLERLTDNALVYNPEFYKNGCQTNRSVA